MGTMRLFGHRGASFDCPENTRVSFETALENGANGVECDIQLLADGNVVILHDDTLRRTANSPLNAAHESVLDLDVSQLTWEQVQPIDVGAYRGPQWAGQRVLLLEEFLAIVAGHDTACCLLELKGADEAIIQPAIQVAQAAIAAGMAAERLIWISFDLSLVKTINPSNPTLCKRIKRHRHRTGRGSLNKKRKKGFIYQTKDASERRSKRKQIRSQRKDLIFFLFIFFVFLIVIGGGVLVLLVFRDEIVHVRFGFGELHFVHTFASVPVKEGLSSEHRSELFGDTFEQFLDSGRVTDEGTRHLKSTWWDVTHGGLDVVWDPLDEVRRVLVLDVEHLLVDFLHGHT